MNNNNINNVTLFQDIEASRQTVFSHVSDYHNDSGYGEENKVRWVRDSIHGFIGFKQNIWSIIDTPQFQRLRDIKQLGSTYYVFPGATHSRFEHSLGTAYLSNLLMENLQKNHHNNYNSLGLENENEFLRYKTILQISGLCHDLGHGPYSHMFDNELLPQLGITNWKHEDGSNMMLEDLMDKHNILDQFEDFQKKDIELMQELIQGKSYNEYNSSKPEWIYEIISNKKNSIDVDKFDYMKRDSYNVGLTGFDFDFTTLMRETRVIDNTVAYHHKHCYNVYDLFHNRYKLFKQIYQHRVTQGIELMICDAFLEARQVFKFQDIIHDPTQYTNLTDNVMQQIQYSKGSELSGAREILNKIAERKLYRYVTEQLVEAEYKVDKLEIKKYLNQNYDIDPNNIYIVTCKTSYCMKDQNPVDSVHFYKKPDQKMKIPSSSVSLVLPNKFQEQHVRIFVKDETGGKEGNANTYLQNVKKAFQKYANFKWGIEQGFEGQEKQGGKQSKRKFRAPQSENLDGQNNFDDFSFTPQKKVQKEEDKTHLTNTR